MLWDFLKHFTPPLRGAFSMLKTIGLHHFFVGYVDNNFLNEKYNSLYSQPRFRFPQTHVVIALNSRAYTNCTRWNRALTSIVRDRVVNKILFLNSWKINVRKNHILTTAGSKTICFLLESKYYKHVYEYCKRALNLINDIPRIIKSLFTN